MKDNDIKQQLKKIIAEVFEVDESSLPDNFDQKSIEQWDSLAHLQLIMEIEEQFKIKFSTEKVPILISFHELYEEIERIRK